MTLDARLEKELKMLSQGRSADDLLDLIYYILWLAHFKRQAARELK